MSWVQAISRMKENLLDVVEVASRVVENDYSMTLAPKSDKDELSDKLNTMTRRLKELSLAGEQQNWLKSGQSELSTALQGEKDPETICRDVVGFLTTYLNAQVGCVYLHSDGAYRLAGSHAFTMRKNSKTLWSAVRDWWDRPPLSRRLWSLRSCRMIIWRWLRVRETALPGILPFCPVL